MDTVADCLFCRIVRGEIPSEKVYEDDRAVVFRDVNPQAPVHCLVIPKAHTPRLDRYVPGDEELLGHLMLTANRAARATGLEDFRVVVNCGAGAGQTVSHLHLHVLGGRDFSWPPG